ncbi:MAG: hypothetical protein GY858_05530 [Candidatus Omnitrophica bacterium]|nr:hypothetical protein [Candidatus Omnitrophota bacterium]
MLKKIYNWLFKKNKKSVSVLPEIGGNVVGDSGYQSINGLIRSYKLVDEKGEGEGWQSLDFFVDGKVTSGLWLSTGSRSFNEKEKELFFLGGKVQQNNIVNKSTMARSGLKKGYTVH